MAFRIILATLNAKYIHASLGLRYLAANMARHGGADLSDQTCVREFTIQRPPQQVVDALLSELGGLGEADTAIVGLGVYIWNVPQTTEVVRLLKAQRPGVRVVVGGPEVSYEWETQEIVRLADHLITGWGDVSFPRLCRALVHGPQPLMKVITGEQPPLDDIAFPYDQFSATDLAHRVLYVEASRGCPFKCEFCLSALDKTAWTFDLDRFLAELQGLWDRGARTFKFVDRTFNLKIEASARILQFFLDRLEELPAQTPFVHFELVPDQLPERLKALIAQFPAAVLQFEIGIQSFNPEVQRRISRRQDDTKTRDNLQWLLAHSQAHLHTDLIFGLPGESWDSFAQGFDRLAAIGPHEIQLGILKRLRGTPLAQKSAPGAAAQDGMQYSVSPPYTVLQTDAVSAQEVQIFTRLARHWDLVANSGRFAATMVLLMAAPSPFAAFAAFSRWLAAGRETDRGTTPEQLVDALNGYLCGPRKLPPDAVRAALLADYVGSGARANPKALQGYLPRPVAPVEVSPTPRAERQHRHRAPTDRAA